MKKIILLIFMLLATGLYGTGATIIDVRVWDSDTNTFTADLIRADPVDVSPGDDVDEDGGHASVTVGEYVYTVFTQDRGDGGDEIRPYLLRTSSNSIQVWNEDISGFSSSLLTGTSIGHQASGAEVDDDTVAIAADSSGNVYIAFIQQDAANGTYDHLYLSRYNATKKLVEIWNGDDDDWSTTFSDADDIGDGIDAWRSTASTITDLDGTVGALSMVVNADNDVFIGYVAYDGSTRVSYVTMYDKSANVMQVWNANSGTFTDVFADGSQEADGVAHATSDYSSHITLVAAGADVYITAVQTEAASNADNRLAFARFNASNVKIEKWDASASDFSSTLTEGDADEDYIDAAESGDVVSFNDVSSEHGASMVFDSVSGNIYISYVLNQDTDGDDSGDTEHLFLTRYAIAANEVGYWDATGNTFNTSKAEGDDNEDYIDAGDLANDVNDEGDILHNMAVDSSGNLYISYLQENDSDQNHLYFSLYDGSDVTYWDSSISGFTTNKANGSDDADGIDNNTLGNRTEDHSILIDNSDHVYFAYIQHNSSWRELKLSHYAPTTSSKGVLSFWSEQTNTLTQTASKAGSLSLPFYDYDTFSPQLVMTDGGAIYIPHTEEINADKYDGDHHLFMTKVMDASRSSNSTKRRRSSSGTCLISGFDNNLIWFIAGLLFMTLIVFKPSKLKA